MSHEEELLVLELKRWSERHGHIWPPAVDFIETIEDRSDRELSEFKYAVIYEFSGHLDQNSEPTLEGVLLDDLAGLVINFIMLRESR